MSNIESAFLVWVVLAALATLNGIFREKVLVPIIGDSPAQILSALLLCVLVFTVSWFAVPLFHFRGDGGYWLVGAAWAAMTVAFEAILGRAMGKTWRELIAAYDPSGGHLWLFVVIAIFVAPYLAAVLRR